MCIVNLSDATGQYEAVMFSETLGQYRDLIEEGRSVVITVAAEDRPEGVNLRIQTLQSLEQEASRVQKALRIFLRDQAPLSAVAAQLTQRGEGQVSFVVIKGEGSGEVEVELPERYRISPQVASAMRAVPVSSRSNSSDDDRSTFSRRSARCVYAPVRHPLRSLRRSLHSRSRSIHSSRRVAVLRAVRRCSRGSCPHRSAG